jgi:hypothetical protein
VRYSTIRLADDILADIQAPCGSDPAPAPHLLDGDQYPAPGRPNDAALATPPTSYFTPVDIVRSD